MKRRADRYYSGKDDMESDVQILTHIYLNQHPLLTEQERRVAYECHRRMYDYWKQCAIEMELSRNLVQKNDDVFVSSPRSD